MHPNENGGRLHRGLTSIHTPTLAALTAGALYVLFRSSSMLSPFESYATLAVPTFAVVWGSRTTKTIQQTKITLGFVDYFFLITIVLTIVALFGGVNATDILDRFLAKVPTK